MVQSGFEAQSIAIGWLEENMNLQQFLPYEPFFRNTDRHG